VRGCTSGSPNLCLHVTHKQREGTVFFSKPDYDFATDCEQRIAVS